MFMVINEQILDRMNEHICTNGGIVLHISSYTIDGTYIQLPLGKEIIVKRGDLDDCKRI